MMNAHDIRKIVGIMGNIISFGLFLSPLPTFFRIWKKKDVEEFSPIPYLATLLNCLMWLFYGTPMVTPDSVLVVTINGIGLVLELVYLLFFFVYAPRNGRLKVVKFLACEVVLMAAVVVGVLLGTHAHHLRQQIVGILCVVFGAGMYAAPLSVMKLVIQTKSVEYMPFSLSLAGLLNGVVWTAYALIYKFDLFITIPNGLGTLLAACQLTLYFCYCGSTPKKSSKAEVELPTMEPNPNF